jgi:hypothetical protein
MQATNNFKHKGNKNINALLEAKNNKKHIHNERRGRNKKK